MMFQDFGHMENCHKNPNIFHDPLGPGNSHRYPYELVVTSGKASSHYCFLTPEKSHVTREQLRAFLREMHDIKSLKTCWNHSRVPFHKNQNLLGKHVFCPTLPPTQISTEHVFTVSCRAFLNKHSVLRVQRTVPQSGRCIQLRDITSRECCY